MAGTPSAGGGGSDSSSSALVSPATSTPLAGRSAAAGGAGGGRQSLLRHMMAGQRWPSPIVARSAGAQSSAGPAVDGRSLLADLANSSQNLSSSAAASGGKLAVAAADESKMSVRSGGGGHGPDGSVVDDSMALQDKSATSGSSRENAPPHRTPANVAQASSSAAGRFDRSRSILVRGGGEHDYDSDLSERAERVRRETNQARKLRLARDNDARARAVQSAGRGAPAKLSASGGAARKLESSVGALDRTKEQFSLHRPPPPADQSDESAGEGEGGGDDSSVLLVKKKAGARAKARVLVSDDDAESHLSDFADDEGGGRPADSELDEAGDGDIESDGGESAAPEAAALNDIEEAASSDDGRSDAGAATAAAQRPAPGIAAAVRRNRNKTPPPPPPDVSIVELDSSSSSDGTGALPAAATNARPDRRQQSPAHADGSRGAPPPGRWSPRSMAMAPSSVGNSNGCGADLLAEKRIIEKDLDRLLKVDVSKAADGGLKHRARVAQLKQALRRVNAKIAQPPPAAATVAPSAPVPPSSSSHQQQPDARDAMERALATGPQQRLYAGQMTYERWQQVRLVTNDAVERLHRVCTALPNERTELPDPDHLTVELKTYQRQGLAWMTCRETQTLAAGGILADEMGLGKTLSLIALILSQKQAARRTDADQSAAAASKRWDKMAGEHRLLPTGATLVICPTTLMGQWEAEMRSKVRRGRITFMRYHGANRTKDPKVLSGYDVVVTSYGTVASECGDEPNANDSKDDGDGGGAFVRRKGANVRSPLLRVAWRRLVLDEAHNIKTHTTKSARGCCRLPAAARWCLTGTPIHNRLAEFYSLLRFLRHAPFDELAVWKEHIESRQKTEQGRERLSTLVKSVLLRRMKSQTDAATGRPLVDLQPKHYEELDVQMSHVEQGIYDKLFEASRLQVAEIVNQSVGGDGAAAAAPPTANVFRSAAGAQGQGAFFDMTHILVLLLRLRQAAVHFALLKQAVDVEALCTEADGKAAASGGGNKNVLARMAHMSLDESQIAMDVDEGIERAIGAATAAQQMFDVGYASAKVRAVLDIVHRVVRLKEKCVIVSQWTRLLDVVQHHLDCASVSHWRIDGSVPIKDRQPVVDSFNRPDGRSGALLLSLTAGGTGLNLVGGNHLVLVDLHWNPALEQQAADRIHRMGQTRPAYVTKLVCAGTVEKRILHVQEQKKQLAKGVLEGARVRNVSKLTLADLKYLFELDAPGTGKLQAKQQQQQQPRP